jgi:hypothetical protein
MLAFIMEFFMWFTKFIACLSLFSCALVSSTEFTISSYNCGGLSDHYDYLRAAAMQKIMQERHNSEPEKMVLNEKIQNLALKILFASADEKLAAQNKWNEKGYEKIIRHLALPPKESESPNKKWNLMVEDTITSYKVRPIKISDDEVNQLVTDHIAHLSNDNLNGNLSEIRTIMAKRIFATQLKHDIICLQEADYLDSSMFPSNYTVMFDENAKRSINGIAFDNRRFELENDIGVFERFYALQLRDLETGKIILVISGHLSGCNPYHTIDDSTGIPDSRRGDRELQRGIEDIEDYLADLMVIGMDSNVTSVHPRMEILKNANYILDFKNYLEPTCANPHQVLNTRIDWIALKEFNVEAKITNIPVLNVNLNCIYSNMSDHKPIASKISYQDHSDVEEIEKETEGTFGD